MGLRIGLISFTCFCVLLAAAFPAGADGLQIGDWIKYRLLPANEFYKPHVTFVTITAFGKADNVGTPGQGAWWWEMEGAKADGTKYLVWALSDCAPMTHQDGGLGRVYRYIFRQQGRPALEYVNHKREALLPKFDFRTALVPTPSPHSMYQGPFLATGQYLGQPLAVEESGASRDRQDWGEPIVLKINDDVIIGTGRTYRDVSGYRLPLEEIKKDYPYRAFEPADYDRMVEAGFNRFLADDDIEKQVRERPAFYQRPVTGDALYPDLFYRSNWIGTDMFSDEPAIRGNFSQCKTVADAANLLRTRVFDQHLALGSSMAYAIAQGLIGRGYNLGDWVPLQADIPAWEGVYQMAWYEMEGGAAGIVQEGVYQLEGYNSALADTLGPGVEITDREMLQLNYAFMRGAARCLGKEWGMSIYGQADPKISPIAVTLAYDMGARWIWWWTSDHYYHLPFEEQLELTRVVREHERVHPRGDRREALRRARVAVAFPWGYSIQCSYYSRTMWKNKLFRSSCLNEYGGRYGDIVASVLWEGLLLAKQGVDFDFVVDSDAARNAGYEQIICVDHFGRVSRTGRATRILRPAVTVEPTDTLAESKKLSSVPKATATFAKKTPRIDGDLGDWAGAHWLELSSNANHFGEKWGGPDDLSAQFAFAYDEQALYIAAEVSDDAFFQELEGPRIWNGDSVQVAIDPLLDRQESLYAKDDVDFGFALVNGKAQAVCFEGRWEREQDRMAGADLAVVRRDDETIYEARLPFEAITLVAPGSLGKWGLNFAVNDSDGGKRKGALQWAPGLVDLKKPGKFGILQFQKPPAGVKQPPVAYFRCIKTFVRKGTPAEIGFVTGCSAKTKGTLEIGLSAGGGPSHPARLAVEVPAGQAERKVSIATSELEPGSYDLTLSLRTDGEVVGEGRLRIYVTP